MTSEIESNYEDKTYKNKDELEKIFLKVLHSKKLIHKIINSFDRENTLRLLSYLGEKDAPSYVGKSKERVLAYIQAKIQLIKPKEIIELSQARKFFLFLIGVLVFKKAGMKVSVEFLENGESEREDKESELAKLVEEKFYYFEESIAKFIQDKDWENLYLAFGSLVTDQNIYNSLDEDEFRGILERIVTADDEVISDVTEVVRGISEIIKIEMPLLNRTIQNLQKAYIVLSNNLTYKAATLTKFGELPTKDIGKDFEDLKFKLEQLKNEIFSKYKELTEEDVENKNQYTTLQNLIELLDSLKKRVKENHKRKRNKFAQAFALLNKAKQIYSEDKKAKESLMVFQIKIDELKDLLKRDRKLLKSVLDENHPVFQFYNLIGQAKTTDSQTLITIESELAAFCDSDNAKSLIFNMLLGKILKGQKKDTNEEIAEELESVKKQKDQTQQTGKVKDGPEAEALEKKVHNDTKTNLEPLDVKEIKTECEETQREFIEVVIEEGRGEEEKEKEIEKEIEKTDKIEKENVFGEGIEKTDFIDLSSSSEDIARAIDPENLDKHIPDLQALIWHLIAEDKMTLAFYLARSAEKSFPNDKPNIPYIPSWIVKSLIMGKHVRFSNGTLSQSLKQEFLLYDNQCFIHKNKLWNHAIRFLLASATTIPSLLAPETGAPAILTDLWVKDGLEDLHKFLNAIAQYGNKHKPLELSSLKKVMNQSVWQNQIDLLHQKVEIWAAEASQKTFAYLPAGKVWRKWLEKNEIIHSLLQPMRAKDFNALKEIESKLKELENAGKVKEIIDYTDRKIIKRFAGDDITGKSLNQIIKHTQEACGLARQWMALCEARPKDKKDFIDKQIEQLKQTLEILHDPVVSQLKLFAEKNKLIMVSAGVNCCLQVVSFVRDIFNPEKPLDMGEPTKEFLLSGELLKNPAMRMDEEWNVTCDERTLTKNIIDFIGRKDHYNWTNSFDEYCKKGDFESTEKILKYLQEYTKNDIDLDNLRLNQERSLRDSQEHLKKTLTSTRAAVDDAVMLGLLLEKDRSNDISKIEHFSSTLLKIRFFPFVNEELEKIRNAIKKNRNIEVDRVRKRMESFGLDNSHNAYNRIDTLLKKGDVLTANEYIELLEKKQTLPDENLSQDVFNDFFPRKLQKLCEFLVEEIRSPHDVTTKIRTQKSFGDLNMQQITGSIAKQAADALEVWFTAKKAHNITSQNAKELLDYIGFNTIEVRVQKQNNQVWLDVVTEPLSDKAQCPVADYGSNSGGKYRVLCVWGRPSEEDIINYVGRTHHNTSILVFYFGCMTEMSRRYLARLCSERRRTFLVVDEIVMVRLSAERRSRLPVMFDCTLPFTSLQPYTIAAGLVPPEMFYGREREKISIMDPMGSCFIYGGRQIGKTALLRDVERTYHMPGKNRISIWCDLKVEGVGDTASIDAIWRIIGTKLKDFKVLPNDFGDFTRFKKFSDEIVKWVKANPERSILILLDEADRFLEVDADDEFNKTDQIRGLMNVTNRRFKVVFAGLHNVLRTTTLSNHPLAHYGEPLCIGPLLDHGEIRDARALIENPLTSLGYKFESLDLVTRILSQTNYYPNLIQLYCNQLLKHILELQKTNFDIKNNPPYIITENHVKEAYESQELRKQIRDRFLWTLQLDQRYEVIAYSLVNESADNIEDAIQGYPVSQIRNFAISWWPAGFKDTNSLDAVHILLDEMVGLGILRQVDQNRYALRSPNVKLLMGTEDEIEAALVKDREPPPKYEAKFFRRGEGHNSFRRSPLTASQESQLLTSANRVFTIFGCKGSGLNNLKPFLRAITTKEHFVYLDEVQDKNMFTKRLENLSKREKEGTTLVIVPESAPWSEFWIEEAIEKIGRLTSKMSFVKIIFCADPKQTWNLIDQNMVRSDLFKTGAVNVISLGPWHDTTVREWLSDLNFGPTDKNGRNKITETTGNWPALLEEFYHTCENENRLYKWQDMLKELSNSWYESSGVANLANLLGIECELPQRILSVFATIESQLTLKDLVSLMDYTDSDLIEKCLKWADLLRFTEFLGNDTYRLDPVIGRILKSTC